MSVPPVLSLNEFGVCLGQRVIISSVTMDVPARGVTALLGPSGTGKSTLLRTLAGLNDCRPALRTWGTARYQGEPLEGSNRPAILVQNFRMMTASVLDNIISAYANRSQLTRAEQRDLLVSLFRSLGLDWPVNQLDAGVADLTLAQQRQIALARAYALQSALICVDESEAAMSESGSKDVLRLIRRIGEDRAVLWVTHNQRHARGTANFVALMAGGVICEWGPAEVFFEAPRTDAGRTFVKTGGCPNPAPTAHPEEVDPALPKPLPLPRYFRDAVSQCLGPQDFFWLEPGVLGGLPRPGIVNDLSYDLESLRRLGVTVLVTLEETPTIDPSATNSYGMRSIHFPIVDMGVPPVSEAIHFCGVLESLIRSGAIVALHCRAGMGRTGTMMACQLVWRGYDEVEALERTRNINPRWLQSQRQVEYLSEFRKACSSRPGHAAETVCS
jgi:atypical dual specificity phosphatase